MAAEISTPPLRARCPPGPQTLCCSETGQLPGHTRRKTLSRRKPHRNVGLWFRLPLYLIGLSFGFPSAINADPPSVSIMFRVYPIEFKAESGIYYQDSPKSIQELRFRDYARSGWFRYQGPQRLTFFRFIQGEEGMERRTVASVLVPDGARELLLFFVPMQHDLQPGFQVLALNDELRAFPGNHLMFLNGTGMPLSGIIDDQRVELPQNQPVTLGTARMQNRQVPVWLAAFDGARYFPVLRNQWRFYRDQRTIIVLLPPKGRSKSRIRAYRISEYVPDASSEESDYARPR